MSFKFSSRKCLRKHFKKHGSAIGAATPDEFLKMANEVIQNGEAHITKKWKYVDPNIVRFANNSTGENALVNLRDKKILSYYVMRAYEND